jgi:hypothetical protein
MEKLKIGEQEQQPYIRIYISDKLWEKIRNTESNMVLIQSISNQMRIEFLFGNPNNPKSIIESNANSINSESINFKKTRKASDRLDNCDLSSDKETVVV